MPPEFVSWAESVSLWQVIGWIGAAVGTWLFVWKGWPWLRKTATAVVHFAQIVDAVQELPAFIERTDKTLKAQDSAIADIHHEVHFNNGSSVKDGVSRLESGVADLSLKVSTFGFRTRYPSPDVSLYSYSGVEPMTHSRGTPKTCSESSRIKSAPPLVTM